MNKAQILKVFLVVLLEIVIGIPVLLLTAVILGELGGKFGIDRVSAEMILGILPNIISVYLSMLAVDKLKKFVVEDIKVIPIYLAVITLLFDSITQLVKGYETTSITGFVIGILIAYFVPWLFLKSKFSTSKA